MGKTASEATAGIPPFQPFQRYKATRMYRNNLPHWRQAGATYFVTFRLGDALPPEVAKQIWGAQVRWLKLKGIEWDPDGQWHHAFDALPSTDRREYSERFSRVIHQQLDAGYGECILRIPFLRYEIEASLRHFHKARYWLGDFVIIPNHLHLLITPLPGQELEDLLASIKKYSARRINLRRGKSGRRVWQADSYDHIVRDLDELKHFRRYIAQNPVEAGLPDQAYTYHRAAWMDAWII